MSSIKEPLGRTEEERDYNSLNRRAWAIFAPFYDDYALPRNASSPVRSRTTSSSCTNGTTRDRARRAQHPEPAADDDELADLVN